ncbi:sensor histidine kinase [Actinoplanes sichuanensis]|uniref:histidine kinase n=1 Tax=Actinoplanes sichuanensis TaxID=512349 RepID=A0ABW4A8F5_9ACTN|nr:HAMP domain-containing sensor histidine kinase [Actinoplanes sichuanensis]
MTTPGPVDARRAAAARYRAAMAEVPQILELAAQACQASTALIVVTTGADRAVTYGIDDTAEFPALLWDHVQATGRAVVIDGGRFMAAAPLHHEGHLVGALGVFGDAPRPDGEQTGRLLSALARRVDEETRLRHRSANQPFPAAADHHDVVSAISHEIRTPLANIVGFAEMLVDTPPADLPGAERRVAAIRRNTDRLCRTVDNLLHAAGLQMGQLVGERRVVDLAAVVSRAVTAADDPDGRLDLRLPEDPVPVMADARLVHVAVGHLLSNALRFSGTNCPVAVSITAGPSPVVTVRDSGPGLGEAELGALAIPFVRGAQARDDQVPGLGLGLSICRGIVHAHGGTLSLTSPPGEGLTARITLPEFDMHDDVLEGVQ